MSTKTGIFTDLSSAPLEVIGTDNEKMLVKRIQRLEKAGLTSICVLIC
jgi:hypothetical protein